MGQVLVWQIPLLIHILLAGAQSHDHSECKEVWEIQFVALCQEEEEKWGWWVPGQSLTYNGLSETLLPR